jgi:L-asparaginase
MSKKVVFLGTGGTIAGAATLRSDNVGYQAGQIGVERLIAGVPALVGALGELVPESEQILQIDSKDMNWAGWRALYDRSIHHLQRDDVQALVITHGTDTLEETAFFLSQVLTANVLAHKPVIMTCAMRPATAEFPDGPQNLCDAVVVASDPDARGVLVVCAGVVHASRDVQKIHSYRVDAFSSGESGPVGFIEEGRVRWQRLPKLEACTANEALGLLHPQQAWPRVELVMNAVGIGGAMVRSLCENPVSNDAVVAGIVVAGTGNGTINSDMESALIHARNRGVRVVTTTRCVSGQLVAGRDCAIIDAQYLGLSPVKARVALVLELLRAL